MPVVVPYFRNMEDMGPLGMACRSAVAAVLHINV